MKLECQHADTCLSGFWGGHHLPHISVPVYKGMQIGELKRQLLSEINQGAVCGDYPDSEKWDKKARAAINRITPAVKRKRRLFEDLEPDSDNCDESVYAYFVFTQD